VKQITVEVRDRRASPIDPPSRIVDAGFELVYRIEVGDFSGDTDPALHMLFLTRDGQSRTGHAGALVASPCRAYPFETAVFFVTAKDFVAWARHMKRAEFVRSLASAWKHFRPKDAWLFPGWMDDPEWKGGEVSPDPQEWNRYLLDFMLRAFRPDMDAGQRKEAVREGLTAIALDAADREFKDRVQGR
jgi:hypothetical protein